ncbi:MAG: hypothetical protein LQ344_002755 [Seirophora lacunosa]|nr:MAG: hypothetical protein LQ344_002755 [Seirophora lacunosa]
MFIQYTLIYLLWIVFPIRSTPTGPVGALLSPVTTTCSDYCRKGLEYWRDLQVVLAQEHPQDVIGGKAIFDRDYRCEWTLPELPDMDRGIRRIKPDLELHGFEWALVEAFATFSINPITGQPTERTAYNNMLYTAKGLVLALENFRRDDEQKTLPFSEVLYQTWRWAQDYDDRAKASGKPGHPGGGSISTLQTMVQVKVQNEETIQILQAIWADSHLEYGEGDDAWYGFIPSVEKRNWFYALLATVNVKSTVFLLKDHAAEIGKKTITAIWVRWPETDPDIWIDIGPNTPAPVPVGGGSVSTS